MKIETIFLPATKERRFGKLLIGREQLWSSPDEVQMVLATCLVLSCDLSAVNDAFEYDVCHPSFAPLPLGVVPPVYGIDFQVQYDDDGNRTDMEFQFRPSR
jgi:hypothetical protein